MLVPPMLSRNYRSFGLFLTPGFPLLPFSAAIEAMRAANRWSSCGKAFDFKVITKDGGSVKTSAGVEVVADTSLQGCDRVDTLLVVAGSGGETYDDSRLVTWMRHAVRRGKSIGGVSLGSYILARAGLLDDHRCTVHWENLDGFRARFPNLNVTDDVFEIDRTRLTCSGGTAVLDLMLAIITRDHGRELAIKVADQFIHERIRDHRDRQRMALRARLGASNAALLAAVEMMEQNLEEPLSSDEIAVRVGVTKRQLERLFHSYLKTTPKRFYIDLRLERAQKLLLQTSMSVLEVAIATGYVSASHFAKSYHDHFGNTPSAERCQ